MSRHEAGFTESFQKSAGGEVLTFQVPFNETTGCLTPFTAAGTGTRTGLGQTVFSGGTAASVVAPAVMTERKRLRSILGVIDSVPIPMIQGSVWWDFGESAGAHCRPAKPMATLPAPTQERGDTTDRFEQSRVFDKRHGCAALPGFRHQQIGQGRLPRFFACRSSL